MQNIRNDKMRRIKLSFFIVIITIFFSGLVGCNNVQKEENLPSTTDTVKVKQIDTTNQTASSSNKTTSQSTDTNSKKEYNENLCTDNEEGMDLNYLSFENGGYEYQVYQEYTAKDIIAYVGVKITDKATNKEIEIKGLSNSIEGSLLNLRENKKINTEILLN